MKVIFKHKLNSPLFLFYKHLSFLGLSNFEGCAKGQFWSTRPNSRTSISTIFGASFCSPLGGGGCLLIQVFAIILFTFVPKITLEFSWKFKGRVGKRRRSNFWNALFLQTGPGIPADLLAQMRKVPRIPSPSVLMGPPNPPESRYDASLCLIFNFRFAFNTLVSEWLPL